MLAAPHPIGDGVFQQFLTMKILKNWLKTQPISNLTSGKLQSLPRLRKKLVDFGPLTT